MITGFVYVHKHSTVSLLDHDISENRTFVHFETNSVLKKCFINVKIVNNFNLKPEKDECVKPKLTFSPFKSTRPNQYITGLINISEGSLLLHLAEHAPHVLYKGSGLATVASFAAWCPPPSLLLYLPVTIKINLKKWWGQKKHPLWSLWGPQKRLTYFVLSLACNACCYTEVFEKIWSHI